MSAKTRKTKKSFSLSDRTKKMLAIGSGCVVVLVGAWWAYFEFTTVPPPDLKTPDAVSKVEEVVEFMGNERGLGRMSVPRAEAFLLSAYQTYGNNPEARTRFVRAMNQMSTGEREVLNNAVFEIGRAHVMQSAREYASVAPSQRSRYIDGAYSKFEEMRAGLSGRVPGNGQPGVGGPSLSEPLNKDLPKSTDEMMKVLVDKTSARERSEAKPFIDAMAAKHKERQAQKSPRR